MRRFGLPLILAIPLAACQTGDTTTGGDSGSSRDRVTCLISVGASSGNRYAAMKCRELSNPGNVSVQGTFWENKDYDEFRSMARLAGRKFTCDVKPLYNRTDSGVRTRFVDLKNCK